MRIGANSGFSVVELLLSLALMSLIAIGLAGSLQMAGALLNRSEEFSKENVATVALRVRLRDWLHSAVPTNYQGSAPAVFYGDQENLVFTTLVDTRIGANASFSEVTIDYANGEMTLGVIGFDGDGNAVASYSGVLAESISEASISFWDQKAQPPGWTNVWPPSKTWRPQLVRITGTTVPATNWPEFVADLVLGEQ